LWLVFEELSRPEGTQILARCPRPELAGMSSVCNWEKAFKRLAQAPSNIDLFKHGSEVYRQLVATAQISFRQVAAQYAITSLFGHKSGVQKSEAGIHPFCFIRHP